MLANSASPYGTCRGSSSSRITGLTNRILAMPALLCEPFEARGPDAGAEQDTALGTVHGLACGRRGNLEEHVTEPVVGRVGEPGFPEHGVLEMDERFGEPIAEHLLQLREVLGLRVGCARRVAEIEAEQPEAGLAEHRVAQD